MPDPLVIIFPGSAYKEQILALQNKLASNIGQQQIISIATIMQYLNLSTANEQLENKLIERGNLVVQGHDLFNEYRRTLYERVYDTGDQLKEVYIEIPRKVDIRIIQQTFGELVMYFPDRVDFLPAKNEAIVTAKGLPDSTGFGESFIIQSISFNQNGNETVLKEEFGDGIIQIQVDYNKSMNTNLVIRHKGNSFKSKFFNTLAATFSNDKCTGGPINTTPVPPPKEAIDFITLGYNVPDGSSCDPKWGQGGLGRNYFYNSHQSKTILVNYFKSNSSAPYSQNVCPYTINPSTGGLECSGDYTIKITSCQFIEPPLHYCS